MQSKKSNPTLKKPKLQGSNLKKPTSATKSNVEEVEEAEKTADEKAVDTGGRHDFFFFVKAEGLPKFALKRFRFGMRWWEDVYFNGGEGIYPIEFRRAYPGM